MVGLLLAGCGSSVPATSTQAADSSARSEFVGTVDNRAISPTCARTACWQPTQFQPALVERESVSIAEILVDEPGGPQAGWPLSGDTLLVQCLVKGASYLDQLGHSVDDWYGIVIPPDKVDKKAKADSRLQKIEQGYRAYVGISWISGGEGKTLPASC